jgi:hypothetical protein
VTRIYVDSPDLTGNLFELLQILHTPSRLISHKFESSSMAVVDSVLVILGRSLVPCAPESVPQLI